VVLWHGNIGGLEQQHRQKCEKERVKWQERITTIILSAGSSAKMAEVGVITWKSANLSEEGVAAWKLANLVKKGCNSIEIGLTLHYLVSRKFFNFHELIV
jgi:hypothetical protein